MSTPIQFGEAWYKYLKSLEGIEQKRVNKAIAQFITNPYHSSLNLEKMVGTTTEWWTIRASHELRIALLKSATKDGVECWTLVRAGHHDQIDLFVQTSHFAYNDSQKTITVLTNDIPPPPPPSRPTVTAADDDDDETGPLEPWTREDLVKAGIPEEYVDILKSCRDEDSLYDSDVNSNVPERVIELAIQLISKRPEKWFENPNPPTEEERYDILKKHGPSSGLSQFFENPEELEALLNDEIERWMVWLHPEQKSIVSANYAGPARIGGAAGTGKTSVALHRLKASVEGLKSQLQFEGSKRRVAFVAFNNNIPRVARSLYSRIPGTDPNDVEFISLHQLAAKILRENRVRLEIEEEQAKEEFGLIIDEIVTLNTPLFSLERGDGQRFGLSVEGKEYLYDEIGVIIKGLGITSLEEYVDVVRKGRQQQFGRNQRKQVWEIFERFQSRLRELEICTWADQISNAYDVLGRSGKDMYDVVVVDEVQDMSLLGLKMIHRALQGNQSEDKPNGLLLIGDGAQRIYKNCYSLQDAGINVVGRSTILKKNYRNSEAIANFALALCGEQDIEDLEDRIQRKASIEDFEFDVGRKPILNVLENRDLELSAVTDWIKTLVRDDDFKYGDIVLLCTHGDDLNEIKGKLRRAHIPHANLRDYTGVVSDEVKVGTIHRMKGLESKVVIIPGLSEGLLLPSPQGEEETDDSYQERLDAESNLIWVAATRARDVLIMTSSGIASPWITERTKGFYDLIEGPKWITPRPNTQTTEPRSTGAHLLNLQPGEKVVHKAWGIGEVITVRGEGDAIEAVVNFGSVGEKRLLLAWAPIVRLEE